MVDAELHASGPARRCVAEGQQEANRPHEGRDRVAHRQGVGRQAGEHRPHSTITVAPRTSRTVTAMRWRTPRKRAVGGELMPGQGSSARPRFASAPSFVRPPVGTPESASSWSTCVTNRGDDAERCVAPGSVRLVASQVSRVQWLVEQPAPGCRVPARGPARRACCCPPDRAGAAGRCAGGEPDQFSAAIARCGRAGRTFGLPNPQLGKTFCSTVR